MTTAYWTLAGGFTAFGASMVAMMFFLVTRVERRLERVEDRLGLLEDGLSRMESRLIAIETAILHIREDLRRLVT